MKASAAIAEILKREGVEILFAYPRNAVIEAAAENDIRPIIVRQERIAVHMADAVARLSRGKKIGVFAVSARPGHRERVRFGWRKRTPNRFRC